MKGRVKGTEEAGERGGMADERDKETEETIERLEETYISLWTSSGWHAVPVQCSASPRCGLEAKHV